MQYGASLLGRIPKGRHTTGLNQLLKTVSAYLTEEQVEAVARAFEFGAEAHSGQTRVSGEPYITHPVAVATILAELRMDGPTVVAAILHDVLEDTAKSKEQIVEQFGAEVAELVDGVSKLTHLKFKSKAEAQAENFRKMLLAMVEDIRVILVKLADRLHNMRTLGVMPPPKRRRIARETLEIYAPIANRLGINSIRLELEDLGFQALYPNRYKVLARTLKRTLGNQRRLVRTVVDAFDSALEADGIRGEVEGREKHLYSVYRKMRRKRLSVNEVLDYYGLRIVAGSVDDCYRILGIAHNLYKPVPGRFKDYIAIPKANGYQGLHTSLVGPGGVPLEVQIRTVEMDRVAESGIAAHWLYKEGGHSGYLTPAKAREWLSGVLEMQKGAGSSIEFLQDVKVDLFPDEVYVFTPQGEIRRLPRGATAVDFAYAVHTDVGNTCVAAKIDRRLVPLRTQLVNGQTVEVITAEGADPNPAWLNFVVTAKARSNIRHFLKQMKHEEAVAMGKRLLDRALSELRSSLKKVGPEQLGGLIEEYGLADVEELYEHVGLGRRLAPLVARRLVGETEEGEATATHGKPLIIRGTEGMVVSFGRCCHPIPGDDIVGYLSSGRGIVIHRVNCRNLNEYRNQPESWIEVEWDSTVSRELPVAIRVDVANERGVLASVAATISELGSNIEHVEVQERDGATSTIHFQFAVRDRRHLADIMRTIRNMAPVMRISRV